MIEGLPGFREIDADRESAVEVDLQRLDPGIGRYDWCIALVLSSPNSRTDAITDRWEVLLEPGQARDLANELERLADHADDNIATERVREEQA